MEHLHALKVVARRTGLSQHVIRIWEKRYNAVTPARTDTNRRLCADLQISRLQLLQQATQAGYSIGQIAGMPDENLRELVQAERSQVGKSSWKRTKKKEIPAEELVAEAFSALEALDVQALEAHLNRAVMDFGQAGLLQQVIVPLIEEIGNAWRDGRIKVAHEHAATAVIRTFLGTFSRPYALPETAPVLVVTTPAGQLHELGAILVAAAADNHGWRVTYLGPSLPAEEIAGAVIQNRARAVALSLVYPEDDPHLDMKLSRLRKFLPGEVVILAGGRAAQAYGETLDKIGAIQLFSLPAVYKKLDDLRVLFKKE